MLDFRKMLDEILESGNTNVYVVECLEYATVTNNSTGDEYVFKDDDYRSLYNDYKNSSLKDEFYFDDYLYIISQSWLYK